MHGNMVTGPNTALALAFGSNVHQTMHPAQIGFRHSCVRSSMLKKLYVYKCIFSWGSISLGA